MDKNSVFVFFFVIFILAKILSSTWITPVNKKENICWFVCGSFTVA